ncbi:hypothetical protein BJX76DRAFT_361304 [Aspergillus varians]
MGQYPNDNTVWYRKNNLTLILDTTAKFEIGKNFGFETASCLVYAETIEITEDIDFPGKNLGLFCTKLIVPKRVTVNVSGAKGEVGSQRTEGDGGNGTPGSNAGDISVFVQEFEKADFDNLEIQANGGQGGPGGNTSAKGKKGGIGGNGGNGGVIEVVTGSKLAEAMVAFMQIDKEPWPGKVARLMQVDESDALFGYLSQQPQQETLKMYQSLAFVMVNVIDAVRPMLDDNRPHDVKALASEALDQIRKTQKLTKEAPSIVEGIVSQLQGLLPQLNSERDVAKSLANTKELVEALSPSTESQLSILLDELYRAIDRRILGMETDISSKLNTKAGAGGPGGHSGPGIYPGPPGKGGKRGEIRLKHLELNEPKEIQDAHMSYIFPEQCQMLLNKTNNQFFSAQWTDRAPMIQQYNRLAKRLKVIDTLSDKANQASGIWKALNELEDTYKVTTNAQGQLRAIADQAISQRNRLLLGQDMFGHSPTWVPRLSYDFYTNSIIDRLEVLREIEELEGNYRQAAQKNEDLRTFVDQGIQKLATTEKEASTKISFLTGPNGHLSKTADRIAELTVELKEKRANVKTKVSHVKFEHVIDPQILIDGFATLTSLGADLGTLKGLWNLTRDLYKTTKEDTIKNGEGKEFKDEYVIRELAECTDSLESLESALKTKVDNEIELDDPKGLKVVARIGDIEKLMQEFKASIPEYNRQVVAKALKEYKEVILLRNETVLDYNSSIHLLLEARQDKKHVQDQAASLRTKRLELDPTIPAVSFWLRGTRDKLALQLTQRLYYASRAVTYWGLETTSKYSQPGPLRSSTELNSYRLQLDETFESILNRYAGNVRSIWPATETQPGLFYDLTSSQLETLTTPRSEARQKGNVYKVSITLQPKSLPFGGGRADVRLNEVRLWLVGAKVNPDGQGRQRVTAHIRHMGDDVFEDESDKQFPFSHDMMTIPFEFDAAKVNHMRDMTADAKLNRANAIQDQWTGNQSRKDTSMNCVAAVGPFATWRLELRESDNAGLDMEKVTSAHIEFRGANRSFTYSVCSS